MTYTNSGTDALICQCVATLGNGVNDLDGSGGDFEFTMEFGSQVNQPDPQLVAFSTATRASVFTAQFPLPLGETITVKVKSPNAADSTVWIKVCIYEVGVESIRDELEDIEDAVNALAVQRRSLTNVYDESDAAGGSGVYPTRTGGGTGVYPGDS